MFWLLVLLILVVFLIYQNQTGVFDTERQDSQRSNQALNTLNERYARGELDTEEYARIKNNLKA